MSMKAVRMGITLPKFIADYMDQLAEELDCSRSDVIGESILYVSQYEDGFKAQFELTEDDEEETELEEE